MPMAVQIGRKEVDSMEPEPWENYPPEEHPSNRRNIFDETTQVSVQSSLKYIPPTFVELGNIAAM